MEAQKIILRELNSEFGGSAEAQKTASAAMSVALGNLAETVGGLVAPAFTFLADKIQLGAAFLQENLGPALQSVGGFFQDLWKRIKPVADFVAGKLVDAFNAFNAALQEDIIPAVISLWNSLKPALAIILKVTAALWVVILEVAPVLIRIVGKIVEVIAGIVGVISNVIGAIVRFGERVVTIVGHVWDFLKKVAAWIADKFIAGWQLLGDVAAGIWSGVVAAAQAAWNIARGILNVIISGINRVHDALAFANPFGGAGWDRVDPLGSGGIVTKPTLALIGERGPEAVVPLGSAMGGVNVTVNGWVGTDQALALRLRDVLLREKPGLGGSLGLA
jgi:phage-related protein